MPDRPDVVCLCGSLRFASQLARVSVDLALSGVIVLAPAVVAEDRQSLTAEQRDALGELHLRRIDLADRVLVVNPGGYLGEAVSREIAYARAVGTPVSFTEPG